MAQSDLDLFKKNGQKYDTKKSVCENYYFLIKYLTGNVNTLCEFNNLRPDLIQDFTNNIEIVLKKDIGCDSNYYLHIHYLYIHMLKNISDILVKQYIHLLDKYNKGEIIENKKIIFFSSFYKFFRHIILVWQTFIYEKLPNNRLYHYCWFENCQNIYLLNQHKDLKYILNLQLKFHDHLLSSYLPSPNPDPKIRKHIEDDNQSLEKFLILHKFYQTFIQYNYMYKEEIEKKLQKNI